MINKRRHHIGVVFSNLDNTCQHDIWSGIVEYAHKSNVHLTAYIGSYQTTTYDCASHFDTCFRVIRDSDSLDGVIVFSGFIANSIGNDDLDKLVAGISEHVPCISISYVIPGITSVLIDNVTGMYSTVEHLIQVDDKKHIAFVKGPQGHPEADDRFEGYKKALAAYGIAYDDSYVFPGSFSPESGVQAVKSLLKRSDISIDAIVACDDETAIGVLSELKNHDLDVPSDIAVAGFDDDRDSAIYTPSLSTVKQDFGQIGEVSIEMLLNKLNGIPVDEVVYIAPSFIARESCGCRKDEFSCATIKQEEYQVQVKKAKKWEHEFLDSMVMLRRIACNLVVVFNIDSLVEELQKSLPELSINTAIIGLYHNSIISGDPNADRTIDRLIGFDGERKFNVKCKESKPVLFSDYSTIAAFNTECQQRDLIFLPLFFRDEEYGILLMPFYPEIAVNVYETLRVNISTAIKGANLIKELELQNNRLKRASNAKSEFLSTMSHEMRTPMNAIIGMTAIGKKATDIEEKNYSLSKIEDASSHLLDVINDVLDMAKIEANKLVLSPVEFQFDKMLQKVVTVINYRADEKKQTLSVHIDNRIPRFVVGDDKRLTQVLANLLSNAVKFTPIGGKINMEVSLIEELEECCQLRVEVTDNGIGISPHQQANIFKAFEQAESGTSRMYGGTGLGLVISKNIIELMGGRIWVESELGMGAKFIFTICLPGGQDNHLDEAPIEKADTLHQADNEFAGKRMLLAEDVEINREIFMALVADSGLIIECAENGKEALDMVEAAPDKYDIVFMDVQMPLMSGYEATRRIRALPALQGVNFPIIAMTANVFKSDIEDCLAAGMDDHLGKPLDIDKVFQVLGKYLQ